MMTKEVQNAEAPAAAPAAGGTALTEVAATQAEVELKSTGAGADKLETLYDSEKSKTTADTKAEPEAKAPDAEAKGDDKEATEAKADDASGIDYDAITVPEGFELDAALMDKAKPIFEEIGIKDQAGVQRLVDFFSEIQGEAAAASASLIQATHTEWLSSIKTEWGADYESNLGIAAKAVGALGGDELKAALNVTGAGNNPAIIKAFQKVGKLISEDQLVAGDKAISKSNGLSKLYSSM
jgi:hypothetical protein